VSATVRRWLDLAVFLCGVAYVAVSAPHGSSWYVGLALVILFTPLWFIARLRLGASFSVAAQARGLVTTGLYSKVRHPVYVFGTVAVVGMLIAWLGWKAVSIAAIIVPIQILRAVREERVLATAYGDEYEAYRRTTWF
jgi:protein-S-isoprenylcysteine O-methyltransferase Ste14